VSTEDLLDAEALDRVRQMQREGQPDILTRLIDVYLSSSKDLIENLEKALADGDVSGIELNAHTLKSSSANLGAMTFSQLCGELEEAARAGDTTNVQSQVEHITSEFEGVCDALRKERKDEQQ